VGPFALTLGTARQRHLVLSIDCRGRLPIVPLMSRLLARPLFLAVRLFELLAAAEGGRPAGRHLPGLGQFRLQHADPLPQLRDQS
jgi:hypothetical protein